jgi:hypothetical protein
VSNWSLALSSAPGGQFFAVRIAAHLRWSLRSMIKKSVAKKPTTAKKRIKRSIKAPEPPNTDGVYLTTVEAAHYLKLSRQFFEGARYRADGSGPPFIKLERAVRYRKTALDDWMAAHDHAPDKPL